jgi:hypothetical protein
MYRLQNMVLHVTLSKFLLRSFVPSAGTFPFSELLANGKNLVAFFIWYSSGF